MPLQRSFSEQCHSTKSKSHRLQWSRNRSLQEKNYLNSNLKPSHEKPPLPVSTATKKKLSNFQYSGQLNSELKTKPVSYSDDQKVYEDTPKDDIPKAGGQNSQHETNKDIWLSPAKLTTFSHPSTPASRLALPDLISMGDVRPIKQVTSPEDRVEWDHNKGEDHECGPNFGAVRAAKKRTRSSSPIGSSPISTSVQFDPGSELWGRYSFGGSKLSTSQGPSVTSLAHIMHTLSPKLSRTGITPRSAAELRRANSCGSHFPKRIKLSVTDDDVFNAPAIIGPSKLSVLIERVQEGLTKPMPLDLLQEKLLDTSNELATSDNLDLNEDPSILNELIDTNEEPILTNKMPQSSPILQNIVIPNNKLKNSGSSDYGDFDDDELDNNFLDSLTSDPEITIPQQPNEMISVNSPGTLSHDRRSSSLSSMTIESVKLDNCNSETNNCNSETNNCNSETNNCDSNVFDESEDELLSADLEVLVSQYDTISANETKSLPSNVFTKSSQNFEVSADNDDEFDDGDLDDDDFKAAEASTLEVSNSHLAYDQKTRAIQRYLVIDISLSAYEGPGGRLSFERILKLQIEDSKNSRYVHIRGIWIDTPVTQNSHVHVIGSFNSNDQCIVDDDNNLLILHPDHLISSTVVADSFNCMRRAVLQDRVKATSEVSAPLIYGTLLHEIFQAAMLSNQWETNWLNEVIENVTIKHLEDLYVIKVQQLEAVEYLKSKMPELQSWAKLFISQSPKPKAIVKELNGKTASMSIDKVLDVEEHIWSPMYGLKGNIDVTVQATIKDEKQQRTLIVPFEIKTGKNQSVSHRAQTALYGLLLSNRYDVNVAYGILYYMETSETNKIPISLRELRHMIIQRNQLACFVRERSSQLPDMLKNENLCNNCYAKIPCFIYHKLSDNGTCETSRLKSKFDKLVGHLTANHREFFLKWDDLLTKEEKVCMKFRRELWTMLSSEREKLGRCISYVIIEPGSSHKDHTSSKIAKYHYNMIKYRPIPEFSFLDSQITVGEPIVISDEKGHFALANGYATRVWKHRIAIQVDRELHNTRTRQAGFDEVDNQVFSGIIEAVHESSNLKDTGGRFAPIKFRIDKDEFSNGMSTIRNNLIQVMAHGPFGSLRIRNLIVDLHRPQFKIQSTSYILKDSAHINVDQRRAIEKVMCAEDYALILGMPGTGKTTTIAFMIRALVSQGKSVLLTSYTHTAVDNILLKLKDDDLKILRLGQPSKISLEVKEFVVLGTKERSSIEEIRSDWHDTPIVATTCLGINHPIFNERTFDFCIVDEASQITLPVCLGPIRLARIFILVGDHFQLPPLVQNEDARKGGLDISLFKYLSDNNPASVVYLEHQYRMCEDVMTLSNNLIYNGRLKCGSQAVSKREIFIPNLENLRYHHFSSSKLTCSQESICSASEGSKCWLRDLINPETKVSFINTDPLLPLSREEEKGNRIVNSTEASICAKLVQALITVGVPASSIGVMTHYRSQLALLKHFLRPHNLVEMHTADRFQGRDKEVVVLSLVRSNEAKSIGELLKDWRRVNVAFTRAKTKLLVVGSRETLRGSESPSDGEEEMMARFVRLMECKEWIYDLPTEALDDHYFPDEQTQITASVNETNESASLSSEVTAQYLECLTSELNLGGENIVQKPLSEHISGHNEYDHQEYMRQPRKRNIGIKPLKITHGSIINDVINEVLN